MKPNEKPSLLIIGNSQTHHIREDKLSQNFDSKKLSLFTIDQAMDVLKSDGNIEKKHDAILIHLITNDLRNSTTHECAEKLKDLVKTVKNIHNPTSVVL